MQGINRSAAAVMAYLICHTPLTLEEAFQAVKSIRPQANIMQV
jgi:protein-tyrosine phosphatase